MLINKFNVDAPTYNELKRLSRIAADGYALCWLSALRGALKAVSPISHKVSSIRFFGFLWHQRRRVAISRKRWKRTLPLVSQIIFELDPLISDVARWLDREVLSNGRNDQRSDRPNLG
jgi:hypothetical protein